MKDAAGRLEHARTVLAEHARISLGHYPTPLEALPRWSEALGAPGRLWTKRDDCSGLGMGGNKVRKLEFLLGAARDAGATAVLTTGALQSNHARQTAAAAARLGLRCELVLPRLVPRRGAAYERSGNRLLDGLFGAEVFETEDATEAAHRIAERMAAASERGETLYPIPPGGSSTIGCLGFASGAVELFEQVQAAGLDVGRIAVAVSTGGTLAGLLAGLALLGWKVPVTGVCVYQDAASTRADVERLFWALAGHLPLGPADPPAFTLRDDTLGAGYGIPTDECRTAIRDCATHEGLLLDPVYTGKAMAAVCDDLRREGAGDGGAVVFWHTGGAPALFAYPDELG